MSADSPREVIQGIRAELVAQAGGYLRNVVREPRTTCQVCCTPVDGYQRCKPCNDQYQEFGPSLADLVVPLTYAASRAQSGLVLRHYKDHPREEVRARFAAIVSQALFLGLVEHERCVEIVVGMPVTTRLTVPSLSGRAGPHPLSVITDSMRATSTDRSLVTRRDADARREVGEGRFDVSPGGAVRGRHVLLIDDTRTTGSRTQWPH